MTVRRTTLVLMAFLLAGSSTPAHSWVHSGGGTLPAPQIGKFRQANSSTLEFLKVGMTRNQVSDVMGDRKDVQTYNLYEKAEVLSNPYRTEMLSGKDGKPLEVLYYYSYQKKADQKITVDELCPVIFRDGSLEGWGWEYYEKVIGPAPPES